MTRRCDHPDRTCYTCEEPIRWTHGAQYDGWRASTGTSRFVCYLDAESVWQGHRPVEGDGCLFCEPEHARA